MDLHKHTLNEHVWLSRRINFLPSDRAVVPLIGKQSANWDRLKGDMVTHKVGNERNGSAAESVASASVMWQLRPCSRAYQGCGKWLADCKGMVIATEHQAAAGCAQEACQLTCDHLV